MTLIIVLPAQTANRCRLLMILANYFQDSESVSRIHPSIDRDLTATVSYPFQLVSKGSNVYGNWY
ncbi:hypothetical protein Q5691_16670 [Microcoleus sp. w1-18aA5]|uniref:hypothetical protein n=1 Tax=unclassified Microcoleus TaxID=2642155 RepID=UPI002FD4CF65